MDDTSGNINQPMGASQPQFKPQPQPQPVQAPSPQAPAAHHMRPHMIMLIIAIIAIVAVAVITASYLISSNSKSTPSTVQTTSAMANNTQSAAASHAKTTLLNDLAMAKSGQNAEVSYTVNSTASIAGPFNMSEYTMGTDTKVVSTISVSGLTNTFSIYTINNMTIACTKSAASNISCSYENLTGSGSSLTNAQIVSLPGVSVASLGTSTALNRSCNAFTVSGNLDALNAALSSSANSSASAASSNTTFSMYMCVDNQTGILLKLNMTETAHSQSASQTTVLTSISAKSFSTGTVTSADMTPPVDAVVTGTHNALGTLLYMDCNTTAMSFNVIPTKALTRLNLTGTESVYNASSNSYSNVTLFSAIQTGNYNPFMPYTITVPENTVPAHAVTICANGSCNSDLLCNP